VRVLKQVENDIKKKVEQTLSRADNARAWLSRVAYPKYQNAQAERWRTKNKSQGVMWDDNHGWYKSWKLIRYGGGPRYVAGRAGEGRWVRKGSYPTAPGKGRFVMIASGALVASVIGKSKDGQMVNNKEGQAAHRRVITNKGLEVFTTLEYADDASKERPFMEFSDAFNLSLQQDFIGWIKDGVLK
jgi:hypothetical protein